MSYLVVIPSMVPRHLQACMQTLHASVIPHTLIIDNSEHNIGVPKSWNTAAKQVLAEQRDYLVILSAAMRFSDGLQDFLAFIEAAPYTVVNTPYGWHCVAIHRSVFETIGLFDENFFPAYYEDSDFIRRMELAGLYNPMQPSDRWPHFNVAGNLAETAHAHKAGLHVDFEAMRAYFIAKWGAEPNYVSQELHDALYMHPFNNPDLPLTYCE